MGLFIYIVTHRQTYTKRRTQTKPRHTTGSSPGTDGLGPDRWTVRRSGLPGPPWKFVVAVVVAAAACVAFVAGVVVVVVVVILVVVALLLLSS